MRRLSQRLFIAFRHARPLHDRSFQSESYSRGPSAPPLLKQTVGGHFLSIVSQNGDRTAVVSRHQQARLTYDTLDTTSNALARGLLNAGVKKGDRVGVSLGNNLEYAIVTYAIFKLGAILVPLNPAFNGPQVISALNHLSASSLIIGAETNLPRKPPRSNIPLFQALTPDLNSQTFFSPSVPSLRQIILVDNSSGRLKPLPLKSLTPYPSILEDGGHGKPLPPQNLDPNDTINIQFTSGTTSAPKAAALTHRSILNNGHSIGARMLLSPSDIICCPPPLFHCFGCILGYMASATHGASIVFPSEAFDAQATLLAVQEEKCTALYGVPTMFLSYLELLASGTVAHKNFAQLRTGIAAGSSIPSELMRKLHKVLNLTELTICYGMTETSPVSAMTTTDDPLEKRIDSVGRVLPHVSVKVVDIADRNRVVPVGQRGELAVSGYLVMKEYWGAPEQTKEVLVRDQAGKVWMMTGDEALLDTDGYVKITGRIKDLIIRGGENIHPLEIENCLLAHPGIADVSVVGLKDERYGEVVAAFVVKAAGRGGAGGVGGEVSGEVKGGEKAGRGGEKVGGDGGVEVTEEDVRAWVRERLSHQLVPKYVFWTAGFPKTASGKVQKFRLREEGMRLLERGEGVGKGKGEEVGKGKGEEKGKGEAGS